jgi:hypothetical protein
MTTFATEKTSLAAARKHCKNRDSWVQRALAPPDDLSFHPSESFSDGMELMTTPPSGTLSTGPEVDLHSELQ